ncbi:metallophosphoesterase family protein [Terrilactibacillus laevilacticus]|uniref:Phosphoesterase n=1 Tax=Terrilactibacillus laevilacticus TaxID=1380157 RepID=A0ABW5PT44_9BACI|nr:metallophosphoesterase [Terrilactibacillus laevilacticus]
MKLIITSDSHGLTDELMDLVKRHQDADAFIHCGDSELTPDSSQMAPYIAVKGNCDFRGDFPEFVVKSLEGLNVFVTHGHLVGVKQSPMNLIYKALEQEAQIACFGHTHVAVAFKEGNCVFINPGSLLLPRNSAYRTYVVCDVSPDHKEINVQYMDIHGQPVDEFSNSFTLE